MWLAVFLSLFCCSFCFTLLSCECFFCVMCCLMFFDMFHIQMQLMQRVVCVCVSVCM